MIPQITVLDAGGQYCHLIARKVRELGVYADVAPSETRASELLGRKGVIISGGPSSVYDPGSPTIDPALLASGVPVLGICYGQQLIAHLLGGSVTPGERGEYGFAQLDVTEPDTLLRGLAGNRQGPQQVWMSHRDLVAEVPDGFQVLARTETCPIAAMGSDQRRLYGVQFHPEVAHTPCGKTILTNFVEGVCGCTKDWDPARQVASIEDHIREAAAGRNVFFFVSGGVDSTVAYTLCLKALGPGRVHGTYVDSGLMREGETESVRSSFARLGAQGFFVEDARERFLTALSGIADPERKRHVIGEKFVEVQERILDSEHYLDGRWILGQGTIYPDTIESGGTAKADLIKTHHNRVAGIQKLIDAGRLLEPLSSFYKDEVRAIGRELAIPAELLARHPFPGPGLAIRCLCSETAGVPQRAVEGWILPVRSVGVQGDSRTYRPVLALEDFPASEAEAAALINRRTDVNRVLATVRSTVPIGELRARPAYLTEQRLDRLRRADAIVRKLTHDTGFDREIWQFPVVLVPFGTADRPDSIVLRPIDSVDGMTARAIRMPQELLQRLTHELADVEGVAGVFYDLTNKPPATIEWE
ncbi:MAG TPA: glutamine-hydrolyzing GMP synthase [Bryobacteraceae bacterium]|nr:glutamine-hydrolyzing GMP synthase [Bryobacteraceae bacterium]